MRHTLSGCANFCAHRTDRWAQLGTASHMLRSRISRFVSAVTLKTRGLFRAIRLPWAHSPRLQPLHPFLLTTNVSNKLGNLLSLKGNSNELKTLDSGTVLAQWTLRFPAFG